MNRYKCPACGQSQYSADPHKAGEPCIYCGHKGTVPMKEIDPGKDGKKEDAAL
jgi:DNA-directed RNA polymerase subunit RPC12/RpoP